MFIELTDHLKCPVDHDEAYLVLLPDRMDGRRVVEGSLGCPRCARVVRLVDGAAVFGEAAPTRGGTRLDPAGALALLGLEGPGGFVALLGGAAVLARGLAELLPGVHLPLVNPPAGVADSLQASVLRSPALPLKRASMRGVVIGADLAADPAWVEAALQAALPGNRIVGEGPAPARPGFEILAEAGGVWVARRAPAGRPGASSRGVDP